MTPDTPTSIPAETAYLFRHALIRDAAYGLQLPSERWRLHGLALQLIEDVFGGRPAEVSLQSDARWQPHPSDPVASELAYHAGQAARHDESVLPVQRLYLYRAAKFAHANYRSEESAARWQELAQLYTDEDRAVCLHGLGIANRHLGRRENAEAALRAALEIAQQTGNRRLERMASVGLGVLVHHQGRYELALQLHQQAIAIARELGDGPGESIALNNLGTALRTVGDLASARRAFEEAAEVARAVADVRDEGTALGNLAAMCSDAGEFDEADRAFERALTMLRTAGDLRAEANILVNQSILFSISGRKQQSEDALRTSLLIMRRIGNHADESVTLANLAIICRQAGKLDEAEAYFDRSVAIAREIGERRNLGTTLGEQAVLFRETGRAQRALDAVQEAVAIHRAVGHRIAEASDSCELALCQLACGLHEEARTTWAVAWPALRATGFAYGIEEKSAAMHQACAAAGVTPFEKGAP